MALLAMAALLPVMTLGAAGALAQDYRYSPSARRAAQPASSNSGFFGFLFGAPDPDRYRRRDYGERDSYSSRAAPDSAGGYSTMCVRLCDGYYWPLSYSTGSGGLERDAQRCESSCGAPARLFYHYTSDKVENMVDLAGQPYSGLENAFRYRTQLVNECRCKPEPWSEAARQDYARRSQVAASGETPGEPGQPGEAVSEAPLAANDRADPLQRAYAEPSQRAYAGPRGGRRRERPRLLDNFNPFGRWFN